MRILITGATGLVGSSIVRLCHEENIAVNYLTTRKAKLESHDNYRGYFWNPKDREIDPKCFEGVSAIINLAGSDISKRWTSARKKSILSSRLDSIRTIYSGLEASGNQNIRCFVSASAIGIYPHSYTEFYSEHEKRVDKSFLGEVVVAWENEADSIRRLGIKVAKVRFGLVLSSRGGALPQMAKPVRNYVGAPLGNGHQWQSWIHETDVARLIHYIIMNEMEGVYNGVAPNPVTNTKLTREIAQKLDKPLILPNIPGILLKWILGEMSYILLSSQRVSSKKIENKGFHFLYPNISQALQALYESNDAA